jgi:hypothetical protein
MCQLGLWEDAVIFHGEMSRLKGNYPGNIVYNGVCTGKYFVHNLAYTDESLMAAIDARYPEIRKVNTRQGYTRCSCLPVTEDSFITSDEGTYLALTDAGADVLLVSPGHVELPGFDYGFIGGCGGGLIICKNGMERRTIVFNGNLAAHPDHEKIAAFISDRNVSLKYFEEYPLRDIGSLLVDYGATLF